VKDRLLLGSLKLVPKGLLSRVVGAATRLPAPAPVRTLAMRAFAARYGIDLDECGELEGFRTFGEFFARPLKPGLRPIAEGAEIAVSPVDGVVSERGLAERGRLIQAKGIDYGIGALLADEPIAERFSGGAWATIYLSPRDYHRIHFPLGGTVTGWRYVPGVLWPVNPAAVRGVPGLFAANERLVTLLDTPLGACAVVAVGATIVGRVRAYYDPSVPLTNQRGAAEGRDYETPLPVEKGGQLGAFEMGSTVILIFEPGRAELLPDVVAGARLRVGQPIAVAPALDRAQSP
jgi:phosphatidylserine decarboxylase